MKKIWGLALILGMILGIYGQVAPAADACNHKVVIFCHSALSGQVFEDIDGEGDALETGDEGKSNVMVKLLNSGGTVLSTTTTNANGDYSFSNLLNGTYYVVVNSKEVAPKAGYNSCFSLSDVWAEQTYQADSENTGEKFGGQDSKVADDFTNNKYEHKAKVVVNAGNVSGINFGFNFNLIVNTNDAAQGSLRQFIKNGNAVKGANASIFKVFGSINLTIDESDQGILPTVTDDNLTLDASAQWGKGAYPEGPGIVVMGPEEVYDELIYVIGANNIILRGIYWKGHGNYKKQDDLVAFKNSFGNTVGGDKPQDANYITGAGDGGEGLECINFDQSTIIGNYFGITPDGKSDGNSVAGIGLWEGCSNNLIKKNTITNSGWAGGIYVYQEDSLKNTITQNSIYHNIYINEKENITFDGLGIDLSIGQTWGVTLNDGKYNDDYGNRGIDFPVITKATLSGNTLHLEGYVGSEAGQCLFGGSTIEIFLAEVDSTGYGEGKTYLSSFTNGANGNFNLDITLSNLKAGDKITATTTDKDGNTSEFSKVVEITSLNIPPTITITQPPDKDGTASTEYLIKWEDTDVDDNADITLFWDKDKNKDNNTSETEGKEWGVIATGIKEDLDGDADTYLLDLSKIPSWCPWTRYFYILGKIKDSVNSPVYDYGEGKITIVTKASAGGITISSSGATITIAAKNLSMDAYVIINDKPNNPAIAKANALVLSDKNLSLSTALNNTTYEFKALSIYGNTLSISSAQKSSLQVKETTIAIPYSPEAVSKLKIKEKSLRIFYLNEKKERWILVDAKQKVDPTSKTVSTSINNFGIYRLIEVLSLESGEISHYPNPLKLAKGTEEKVTFVNLPTSNNTKIKIYNQVGELIKTMDITFPEMEWNLRSDKGDLVASGVYFYLVSDETGVKAKGKMAIIK
ncbi:T9SS type A sorting domain-containing protein [bacterium]|nr:T9SS type A sorting domain-containing protein [bacterium]